MQNQKTEVVKILQEAQNVLVTVRRDPSVDQLSAAIGMTLLLNKLGKHGTAVFSGNIPSTIEFLKPEKTLEKTTDSLRDFIISLDKTKADKLRYKVEDQHVKIFITPYRTTLSQDDLVFSHGDFNVDVVLALGVHDQAELDQAITAHGRILHDAKIVTVDVDKPGELGSINLFDQQASSLAEVATQIGLELKPDILDEQMATALLTGIVAETDRFSNEKTRPDTMSVSAKLMTAGANQQLVATKLEIQPEPVATPQPTANGDESKQQDKPEATTSNDGSLQITHDAPPEPEKKEEPQQPVDLPQPKTPEVEVDEHGNLSNKSTENPEAKEPKADAGPDTQINKDPRPRLDEKSNETSKRKRMILEPPENTGTLTASNNDNEVESPANPLTQPVQKGRILSHDAPKADQDKNTDDAPKSDMKPSDSQTAAKGSLTDLEQKNQAARSVLSPEPAAAPEPVQADKPANSTNDNDGSNAAPNLADLQNQVDKALSESGEQESLEPIAALNANPVDLDLDHQDTKQPEQTPTGGEEGGYLDVTKLDEQTGEERKDSAASQSPDPQQPPQVSNPNEAPPVPPPMMPPMPGQDDNSGNGPALPPVNQ